MRRFISIFFILNLLFQSTLGNIPDSLENMLKRTASDTAKVMVYNRFARSFLNTAGLKRDNYDQALQYAQQGLVLAEQIKFVKGEAELLRTAGNAHLFLNDNEKAIEYYGKALDVCGKLQDHNGMALNHYNMGLVYRRQSRMYYSLDNFQKALSLWKQLGNNARMGLVYGEIVKVLQTVGELQLAENYTIEAIRLTLESGNRTEEAALYELLARLNIELGNMPVVEKYFQQALHIYEEMDEPLSVARVTLNIATNIYGKNNLEMTMDLYRKSADIFEKLTPENRALFTVYTNMAAFFQRNNRSDSARHYREKALSKAVLSENLQTMAEAYTVNGRFYMTRGDLNLAEKDFQQAYDIGLKIGITGIQSSAMSELSSVNYLKENYKTAYEYLKAYQTLNDSLLNEDNRKNVQQLTLQYEFEKDEREMREAIKTQLEHHQQAVKHQQTVIAIIVFVLILTTILLAFIIRSYRHKKMINSELNNYKDSLEEMVKIKTRELTTAKEKAEESSRLKSIFLANMSHEIRTPLNGIVGFIRFIDASDLSPIRRREYIKVITSCSDQLTKIIDDIMDISKIEADQMTISPAPVQLNPLMNELRALFESCLRSGKKEHINLFLDDSGFIEPSLISVDKVRLCQVFNSLINNAIKFTNEGYIRFGYRMLGHNMLEFFVEDTGIGIPKNHWENIFLRFYQVDLGNHRFYGGLGLGLSISRSLTQMMGGDIRVKSTEGAGSTFSFTIPCNPCDVVQLN